MTIPKPRKMTHGRPESENQTELVRLQTLLGLRDAVRECLNESRSTGVDYSEVDKALLEKIEETCEVLRLRYDS